MPSPIAACRKSQSAEVLATAPLISNRCAIRAGSPVGQQLGRQLQVVLRNWRKLADDAVRGFGISADGGWTLVLLMRHRLGNDAHQTPLAAEIGISGASLVRRLDRLQDAGLVTREVDPRDRRANSLQLTARGRRIAAQIETSLANLRDRMLSDIPTKDLETVERVLSMIAERSPRSDQEQA